MIFDICNKARHPPPGALVLQAVEGESTPTSPVPRCSHSATKAQTTSGLLYLGLELLEAICEQCSLRDRVALACCCRTLWARPDILASPALWGRLVLRPRHLASPQKRQALLTWLGQHREALRLLESDGRGMGAAIMALLGALGASPLRSLSLQRQFAPKAGAEALGRPLEWCTALTRLQLSDNCLRRLPRQVSGLQRLAELELGGNELWGSPGALRPLEHLAGSLTRLGLSGCGLQRLPQVLASLTALRDLDISGHDFLTGALSPLSALTRLTALDLSESNLPPPCGLPRELSCLGCLLSLDIAQSLDLARDFGDAPDAEAATQPLAHLTALTGLDLSECGLRAMPPQLSELQRLVFLNLRSNWALGRGRCGVPGAGAGDFEPLASLSALTRLVLGSCGLRQLPPQLSACTALECLEVGGNAFGSNEGALSALGHLTALKHLDVGECDLPAPPAELSYLSTLESLELGNNFNTGLECAPANWEPLSRLSSLTYLHTGWCQQQLQGVLPHLSGLNLRDLDLSGNVLCPEALSFALSSRSSSPAAGSALCSRGSAGSGRGSALAAAAVVDDDGVGTCEAVPGGAAQLTALTRLALGHCSLKRLPLQLGRLARLVDLDVSGNTGVLGPGEETLPLIQLPGLTRLDARRCGLQRLPPAFSALVNLVELDLGMNPFSTCYSEGGGPGSGDSGEGSSGGRNSGEGGSSGSSGGMGALEGLQCLRSLRQLSLSECGLSTPPPQLAALSALESLRLSSNPLLRCKGEGAPAAGALVRMLAPLPALMIVDLRMCGQRGELGVLASLTNLGVHVQC